MREYSQADVELLATNSVTQEEVNAFEVLFPGENLNLDVIIGGINDLKAGRGQERNKPFTAPEEGKM